MSRFVQISRRVVDGIANVFMIVATIATFTVIGMVTYDVIARTLTGRGVPGVVEYGEILMVVLVFLGLAHAQKRESHVAVEVVIEYLTPRAQKVLNTTVLFLISLLLLWMAWESFPAALNSYMTGEVRFGLAAVELWPARLAIAVGLLAMGLQALIRALELLQELSGSRKSASQDTLTHRTEA